jgi:hypothetical protein
MAKAAIGTARTRIAIQAHPPVEDQSMGTRADFYIGRGENAEWLGSIAWDGYPKGIDKQILGCESPEAFRHAVASFLESREDKTLPEQGWPWPWETSSTTDYAYAFDDGVHASCFGGNWFDPNIERTDDEEEADDTGKAVFPDMSKAKQRAKFGAHSGIMIIGLPSSGNTK